MKIRPLGDRVVVKLLSTEQTLKSGIVIPDTAKEKPKEGEIVAIGPGRLDNSGKRIAIELKVGERVLFEEWSGRDYKSEGTDYKVLREDEVIGVIEK